MEVRDSGDIPGVTGQGARPETASVIDKIGNDDFDDLKGKPGGRGRACRRCLRGNAPEAYPPDSISSSIKTSLGQ